MYQASDDKWCSEVVAETLRLIMLISDLAIVPNKTILWNHTRLLRGGDLMAGISKLAVP